MTTASAPLDKHTETMDESPQGTLPVEAIHQRLETARRDLLDLTARNRLLNTSRSKARSSRLDIVDELVDEVFRILVTEKKNMTFLPNDLDTDDEGETLLPHIEYEEEDSNGIANRHVDLKLQTALNEDKLHKRLLKLMNEARTSEEEHGVNTLYLAAGFLKWLDPKQSNKERFAPLILIPISLERQSARSRFRVFWNDDELTTNLSLQEKLKVDFGIKLPDLPDADDLVPSRYFDQVADSVSQQVGWEVVRNDMVIWFFSFAKFLMYRDLLPEVWPPGRQIENHELISGILECGLASQPMAFSEDANLDEQLHPSEQIHVTDADSSQSLAIEEARRGRNLVIQGPPGTGKSQTITNLIASAARDGKTVLFVAEKMAALEVVKRRLDTLGLGDMCLELHSHKANKKAVLEDLTRTLETRSAKRNSR